jgi:hypothetical protein
MSVALGEQVQSGVLSLDAYLSRIKARLESDKKLAVFCNQAGDKQSAVRVMRRVKIMTTEIDNVNEAMMGGGGDDEEDDDES